MNKERESPFDVWDRGEHTYDGDMANFVGKKEGESLKGALDRSTICPVGNMTCFSFMELEIFGVHPNPEIGNKATKFMLCAIGITNAEECPLSK